MSLNFAMWIKMQYLQSNLCQNAITLGARKIVQYFFFYLVFLAFALLFLEANFIVILIIWIFMIDLNQKSTIKKNRIDRKISKKISIYSLIDLLFMIDHQLFTKLRSSIFY